MALARAAEADAEEGPGRSVVAAVVAATPQRPRLQPRPTSVGPNPAARELTYRPSMLPDPGRHRHRRRHWCTR